MISAVSIPERLVENGPDLRGPRRLCRFTAGARAGSTRTRVRAELSRAAGPGARRGRPDGKHRQRRSSEAGVPHARTPRRPSPEDALRAGQGSHLEITLPGPATTPTNRPSRWIRDQVRVARLIAAVDVAHPVRDRAVPARPRARASDRRLTRGCAAAFEGAGRVPLSSSPRWRRSALFVYGTFDERRAHLLLAQPADGSRNGRARLEGFERILPKPGLSLRPSPKRRRTGRGFLIEDVDDAFAPHARRVVRGRGDGPLPSTAGRGVVDGRTSRWPVRDLPSPATSEGRLKNASSANRGRGRPSRERRSSRPRSTPCSPTLADDRAPWLADPGACGATARPRPRSLLGEQIPELVETHLSVFRRLFRSQARATSAAQPISPASRAFKGRSRSGARHADRYLTLAVRPHHLQTRSRR